MLLDRFADFKNAPEAWIEIEEYMLRLQSQGFRQVALVGCWSEFKPFLPVARSELRDQFRIVETNHSQ